MAEYRSVGVTGARTMRPEAQINRLRQFLRENVVDIMHHGDCIGADAQMAAEFERAGAFVCAHPPVDEKYRAFYPSDRVEPAREYLQRNRDIVNESELLIALPRGFETQRSGTWSTVRYAVQQGIPVIIWYPYGQEERR
jgi:hypothetical protein